MASKDRAREKAAQMRAEQERRDRRRRTTIIASVTAGAVLVVGGLTWLGVRSQSTAAASSSASPSSTGASITGLETFTDLARDHVTGTVTYPQTPPVGGKHSAVWQNCGWYSTSVANETAVHSMEHGAAWITYRPDLSASDQATLKSALGGKAYVLASAYPGLPAPVVASAWGAQVKLTGVNDPRLAQFVDQYANSPSAPEPGGECTGGTGTPG